MKVSDHTAAVMLKHFNSYFNWI